MYSVSTCKLCRAMSNTWRYTIKEYDGSVMSCKIVVGNPLCPAGSQFNGRNKIPFLMNEGEFILS